VHIAAVKPRYFLIALAAFALPLHAADEQNVIVKTLSAEKGRVALNADLQGKHSELTCDTHYSSCSQPQPGDYTMRPATAEESIYEDCTNVVLLKPLSAHKEKIGVYCWLNSGNDDCHIVSCQRVEVATTISDLPSVIVSPEIGPFLLAVALCL